MPCCPHCIEYIDGGDRSCCPTCGHPETCPPHCLSFLEVPERPADLEGVIEVEDFRSEQEYRADAAESAKALGRALRATVARLGAGHPDVAPARLDLFEAYVDPEWEEFDSYTPGQRARVEACADLLLRQEPHEMDDLMAARFGLRLARIYFDIRSAAKGEALARRGLDRLPPSSAAPITDLERLGWACYRTRQCLEISEECYRRSVVCLRASGREYLDPLDCLQRVLSTEGRLGEAHTLAQEVHALRANWEATRREKFVSTLHTLREKWDWQDLSRRKP